MIRKPSFFRIDEQVFFTMGAVCLIALIMLAFKYATREVCIPIKMSNSDSLVAGRVVRLKAEMPGGTEFAWEFGDGTGETKTGNTITHTFKAPGFYTVTVLVNGSCEESMSIFVTEPKLLRNDDWLPKIFAPDTVYMDALVQFTDLSPHSEKWEWRFGETGIVDKTEQDASYIFKKPGYVRIHLTVNGKPELTASKEILVIDKNAEKNNQYKPRPLVPKPSGPPNNTPSIGPDPTVDPLVDQREKQQEPAPVEKIKGPAITKQQLEAMLMDAAAGKKSMADFAAYLGDKTDVSVAYDKKQIQLSELLNVLRKMKAKNIESISAVPTIDKNTNHLLQIAVEVEKKGFFKRLIN